MKKSKTEKLNVHLSIEMDAEGKIIFIEKSINERKVKIDNLQLLNFGMLLVDCSMHGAVKNGEIELSGTQKLKGIMSEFKNIIQTFSHFKQMQESVYKNNYSLN